MERFGPDSDAHGEDVNMLEALINDAAQTADEGTDMDVDSEGRGGAAAAESSPPTLPAVLVRPMAPIEDVMAMPVDAAPQPRPQALPPLRTLSPTQRACH